MKQDLPPCLAQIGVDVAQSGFDVKKLNTYDVRQCATAPDDRLREIPVRLT